MSGPNTEEAGTGAQDGTNTTLQKIRLGTIAALGAFAAVTVALAFEVYAMLGTQEYLAFANIVILLAALILLGVHYRLD